MTMLLSAIFDNVISRGIDEIVRDVKTTVFDWRAIQKGEMRDGLNDVFDSIFERLFGCVRAESKLFGLIEYIYREKIRDGAFKIEAVKEWACDGDVHNSLKKYAVNNVSLNIDDAESFDFLVERYVDIAGDAQGVSRASVRMIVDVVVSSLKLSLKDELSVSLSANANNRILDSIKSISVDMESVGSHMQQDNKIMIEMLKNIACKVDETKRDNRMGSERDRECVGDDAAINIRIDAYRDMISTDPRAAKDALLKMRCGIDGTVSDRANFRILTNIGACYWALGELKEAAKYFLEALVYDGADPLAIRNAALAHYAIGDFNTATVYAKRAVDIDKNNADGYVLLVALCASHDELNSILLRMPQDALGNKNIKYAIGCCYARLKNFEKAKEFLFYVYEKYPDCMFCASAYAAALLDYSAGRWQVPYLDLDRDASSDFASAIDILEKIFERIIGTDVLRAHMTAVINLAQAYRYMGEVEKVRKILTLVGPELDVEYDLEFLRLHLCAMDRDVDGVRAAVKGISECDSRQCMDIAAAYMQCGEYSEAINVLSGVRVDLCGNDFVRFHGMMSGAIANIRGIESAEDYILNICGDVSLDMYRCVILARMYLDLDEYALSRHVVRYAVDISRLEKGWLGIFVADMCYELEMYLEASVLYEASGAKFGLSRVSRRYAISAFNANVRSAFFDGILKAEAVFGDSGFYRRIKARFYIRIGCLEHAIAEYDKLFEVESGDVHDVLLWLNALVGMRQYGRVREYFDLGYLPENGASSQYMSIALIMAKVGMVREASDFAYSVCRGVDSDFEAHSMYVSMFLSFDLGFLGDESASVHVNSCFSVKSDRGEVRSCIFEDSASELRDGEFRTDHLFFKNFLGMCLGGEWVEIDVFGLRTVWSVVSVCHKFVGLHLKLLDIFEVKYPERFFIKKINLSSEDGGVDFLPLFRVLEGVEGRVSPLVAAYSSGQIPFSVFAKSMRRNVLDMFSRSLLDPNVSMRVAKGANEYLARAIDLLRDANFVVAEITSLYLLHQLGVLEVFFDAFKSVYVVRASLDELDSWVNEVASREGVRECFSSDGKYYCLEHACDVVADELRSLYVFKDIVAMRCCVLPAIPDSDFSDVYALHLDDLLPQATLDSIYAASGVGGLLLSDDLEVRDLARHVSGVEGVWTQSIILHLFNMRRISIDNYISIVCKLIDWKLDWVYVSVEAFFRSCHEDVDFIFFSKIVTVLEKSSIDKDKAIQAVKYVLYNLWASSYSKREVCTYHILSSITMGRNCYACLSEILGVLHRLNDDACYALIQCIFRWCLGHFIDPGKVTVLSAA